ncbi:YkgJ family cysteine cluster protein [Fibrobacter sp. UWEL]|uniref:YkgJ family cysteine cluster protein n=1 Tax=Fibrobacter sp. UWEL TaxID=1896209 RepID=UPI00091495D8|nr:YkgJ family cysteine cluster protein [Fibrobacter sp. UWEL]SHL16027.1 Fe-S-cluster containining protein [Fibrobacter sp. UWEL]
MISEIAPVLEKLRGTEEYDILVEMDAVYSRIETKQREWFEKSKFTCPKGCGTCCEHFEPDLLESEALYMAAWLISNQPETITKMFHVEHFGANEESQHCPFYRSDLEGGKYPGHCSIYGGRASICRLFGAAGSRDKHGQEVWKPCKFYPAEELAAVKTLSGEPILHRQYTADEVQNLFGCLPPVMSDMMEQEECFTPDDDSSTLIHDILPKYIQRLLWIMDLNSGKDPI